MRPAHEDDSISTLYEASYRGFVSTLNTLIQQDPLILHRISQTASTGTPLHISALLGHLDFTKAFLTHKPQLAQEVDSFQRTPLHLASAEGQKETVQALLQVYDDACLTPDQDRRIPLHYAAMRGRTEVVRELIRAKPESLGVLDGGKTVLHLCVTYNHLETLKALAEKHVDEKGDFLNFKDSDGDNTILHLAVMFKQVETIRYLLSKSIIKEEANKIKNEMGLTALEMIKRCPKDFKGKGLEISDERNCCKKFLDWIEDSIRYKGDWLEETRQVLSVVTTVIATMTFQVAMSPPGGVTPLDVPDWAYNYNPRAIARSQASSSAPAPAPAPAGRKRRFCFYVRNYGGNRLRVCPGEAVKHIVDRRNYSQFLVSNTIAFVASLSVTMLLISGIPLKNKFCMWFLSIGMCITLTFLALTYIYGLLLVNPTEDPGYWTDMTPSEISYSIWVGLLVFVAVFITVRFLFWIVNLCRTRA